MFKWIATLIKIVSEMKDLYKKLFGLMQRSKSELLSVKDFKVAFYGRCHFEYLMRIYHVIKPKLNMKKKNLK